MGKLKHLQLAVPMAGLALLLASDGGDDFKNSETPGKNVPINRVDNSPDQPSPAEAEGIALKIKVKAIAVTEEAQADREVLFDKVKPIKMAFNSKNITKRYKDLEAKNQANGKTKRFILYNPAGDSFTIEHNYFWFVDPTPEPYRSMATRITEDYSEPDAKLRAIGVWMQNNFRYLDSAKSGPTARIALEDLADRGGVCRHGVVVFKTLAESIGLGGNVAAAMYGLSEGKKAAGHIAPLIRGKHGTISYIIDGEPWTLFETATTDGSFLPAGSGTSRAPEAFIKADGTVISAKPNLKIVNLVENNNIPNSLLTRFKASLKDLDKLLNDPWNHPKEDSFQIGIAVAYELSLKVPPFKKAFMAIIESGGVSEEMIMDYEKAQNGILELLGKWERFEAKEEEAR